MRFIRSQRTDAMFVSVDDLLALIDEINEVDGCPVTARLHDVLGSKSMDAEIALLGNEGAS